MSELYNKISDAVAKIIADHQPAARTNLGKMAAEYTAAKLIGDAADEHIGVLGPELRNAALFSDDSKAITVYDNRTFALEARESAPRRTFDRARALAAIARRFNVSVEQAEQVVEEFYKTGTTPVVSLHVKVK